MKPYRKPELDHRDGGERLCRDGGGSQMGRGGKDDQSRFVDSSPSFTAGEFRGSSNQFDIGFTHLMQNHLKRQPTLTDDRGIQRLTPGGMNMVQTAGLLLTCMETRRKSMELIIWW